MIEDKHYIDCALCGRYDFRKCPCPWHKPFEQWPTSLLRKLKEKIGDNE